MTTLNEPFAPLSETASASSSPSRDRLPLDAMKLPQRQAGRDEDAPFLGADGGGKQNHSQSVRIALDNLSGSGGSHRRSGGAFGQHAGNGSPGGKASQYEPRPTAFAKVKALVMEKPLVRWLLFISVIVGLFVFVSSIVFGGGELGAGTDYSVPELDFTLENIISASIGLSKLAAEKIIAVKQEHAEHMKVKGKTQEGVDEPVTVADAESNSVYINGFHTLFDHSRAIGNPNGDKKIKFTIVSEETDPKHHGKVVPPSFEYISLPDIGGDVLLDPSEITLIIDPLDATKEYTEEYDTDGVTYMLPYVTTLVCVVRNGAPIAGVVGRPYAPDGESKIVWAAVEEGKVHDMDVVVATGDAANTITISRSHTGDAGDIVSDHFPGKHALKAGGAGYKSYLVLSGQADAYIHSTKIKTWDLCAGHALLKAAGGDITDKDGNELVYPNDDPLFKNGLVASLTTAKIEEYVGVLKNIDFAAQQKPAA